MPLDQLCLSPQCGFSSTVEGNALTFDEEVAKLRLIVETARRGLGLTLPTGPKRNRVTPLGDLVATPLRGAWTGNRGQLHEGTDIKRFHGSQLWIISALEHKGQRLPQWAPGHFTVLFFHDEAVALAAGHRPCALCRREAYNRYRDAWTDGGVVNARPTAVDLDRRLHAERLVPRSHTRRLHEVAWPVVPDGAFVLLDGVTALVLGDAVVRLDARWLWAPPAAAAGRHGAGDHSARDHGRSPGWLPRPDRPARDPTDPRARRHPHRRAAMSGWDLRAGGRGARLARRAHGRGVSHGSARSPHRFRHET